MVRSPRPDPRGEYSLVQTPTPEPTPPAGLSEVVKKVNWQGWVALAGVLLVLLAILAAVLAYRFATLRAGR